MSLLLQEALLNDVLPVLGLGFVAGALLVLAIVWIIGSSQGHNS